MHQELLFNQANYKNIPLANRVCPINIDGFVGHQHLPEKGKVIRKIIMSD
ncbi:hypothetical protein [Limosilactobacillus agrestis]|nr:hypothetical protein [Limosilactobacillus agrestis]